MVFGQQELDACDRVYLVSPTRCSKGRFCLSVRSVNLAVLIAPGCTPGHRWAPSCRAPHTLFAKAKENMSTYYMSTCVNRSYVNCSSPFTRPYEQQGRLITSRYFALLPCWVSRSVSRVAAAGYPMEQPRSNHQQRSPTQAMNSLKLTAMDRASGARTQHLGWQRPALEESSPHI